MTSHPKRVAEAEAMFKQIIRDALGSIVEPSRDRTRPLLQYADVLTWEMVSQWMDEERWKAPIWFDDNTKEIIFIKLHRIHHILKGIFDCEMVMQFYNRGDISQHPDSVVDSHGRSDLLTPAPNKQPSSSFMPRQYPNPTLANAELVPIQQNGIHAGFAWTTVVLEVGTSETVGDIPSHRAKYLGHKTGVNAYVAIAYNISEDGNSENDTWWVSVAIRDIHAPPAGPDDPAEYPPCIIVGETADGPPYTPTNKSVPMVFEFDSALLWYPQPPPANIPPTVKIDCEIYHRAISDEISHRNRILRNCEKTG